MSVSTRTLSAPTSGLLGVASAASAAIAVFRTWGERVQVRAELAELTQREIEDIGLDPVEIEREIAKPFWRA